MNAQDRAAAVRQVQEDSNAFARSLVNGREPNMTYAREFVEHQVAVTKSLNKPRETDLKTVVRKLREDSETFSRSLEVLPNPNRTDASQPRKKRWAARVRTGCVTCRNRRIKCDEGKPDCKRCALTGRTCVYETPESPNSDASSSASPPPIPPKGLPSPDWHVKEACEYYITVMIPMHGYHAAGDSAYDSSYEFAKLMNSMFDPDSFTMLILNHQVQCVSAAHGVQAKFGALPSLGPVWARLFNQMAISVSNLNRYMALAQDGYFVLHRVCDLINTELSLSIPTWRAHAEGYGALVKSYGGIPALFTLKKPPSIQSQYALVTSTMCNSTSPAHDQIRLMSNWSDEDIRIAYSHTGFHAFPCPTVLLQALIRITHLRTLVIHCENVFAVRELVPLAREAFAKIQNFDPHVWDEQYSTKNEFYPIAGEVFKFAVALYGILSLPGPLASVFTYPPTEATPLALADTPNSTTTTISSNDAYSTVGDNSTDAYLMEAQDTQLPRECYRRHLYQLFKDALPLAPAKEGLMWPVAVLGVAFSNHEEEEQQTLREYVGRMRWLPGSDGGAFHLLEKLDTFWASGKTGWDQCYDEPINVLT